MFRAASGRSAVRIERGETELTANVRLPDVPPPGVGLNTVTSAVPALDRSLGVISAVNCVLLTYVVVREEPPHRTTEPDMKLEPVTVNVRARLPAGALKGDIEVTLGTGFRETEEEEDLLPPQPAIIRTNALRLPTIQNRRKCFTSFCRLKILQHGCTFRLIISVPSLAIYCVIPPAECCGSGPDAGQSPSSHAS